MGVLQANVNTYGMHVSNIFLSPLDNKRWTVNDGMSTLVYGNKDVQAGKQAMNNLLDEQGL